MKLKLKNNLIHFRLYESLLKSWKPSLHYIQQYIYMGWGMGRRTPCKLSIRCFWKLINLWDHWFCTYAKFSEKLTFLNLWYAHVLVTYTYAHVTFSGNFAYELNEWPLFFLKKHFGKVTKSREKSPRWIVNPHPLIL